MGLILRICRSQQSNACLQLPVRRHLGRYNGGRSRWLALRSDAGTCQMSPQVPVMGTVHGKGDKSREEGHLREAVEVLDVLVRPGWYVSAAFFRQVIKRCIAHKDVGAGRGVHSLIVRSGYVGSRFLANHVIRMYAAYGRLEDALQVFNGVAAPNAHSWSSIIEAHVDNGQARQAIEIYLSMRHSSQMLADNHLFVAALKACASAEDLTSGRQVHSDILSSVLESDVFIGSCLVEMYARCRRLEDARMVFDKLDSRNVVTWNALLGGYAHGGRGQEALALYANMQEEGITLPDHVTFLCLLKACASSGALHRGRQLHSEIQEAGLGTEVMVGSCLIDMYAKCGSLNEARAAFDNMTRRNVVTWNVMLAGYAERGLGEEALSLYSSMQQEGVTLADHITFVCLLKACKSIGALEKGRQLHDQVQEMGLQADVVIASCLVDMYAKCGSLEDARRVFDESATRDVVTWTAMLTAYEEHGLSQEALSLYASTQQEGMALADHVTFVCLLKASANIGALDQGKQLHVQLQERGLDNDSFVGSCLVYMYAKCGQLGDAQSVFNKLETKTVVSWTAMLMGYAEHGLVQEALNLYASMQQESVTPADHASFSCLLKVCASIGALEQGKQLHAQVMGMGLEANSGVGSCLVDMYAKCGCLDDARKVFDILDTRDILTWNVMLTGYVVHGLGQEALDLYAVMRHRGITAADHVTFACLLKACASVGALHTGHKLHAQVRARGLEVDVVVGSCLVNMYAKCGSLDDACRVFESLPTKNEVTWNAILAAYGQHGMGQDALLCYEKMVLAGIQPNEVTFLSLLSACSHAGLVWEGVQCFKSMDIHHGIAPRAEHYACMIDLLGRAGRFTMVEELLSSMPMQPTLAMLMSVLGSCRKHSNISLGEQVFDLAVRLQPTNAAAYVLMSQMYADAGLLEDARVVDKRRKTESAWKEPGWSWIAHDEEVHTFLAGGVGDHTP